MAAAIPSFSGASRASARAGSTQRDNHGNAAMIREGPFFHCSFYPKIFKFFDDDPKVDVAGVGRVLWMIG